jgi:hypothetical protein
VIYQPVKTLKTSFSLSGGHFFGLLGVETILKQADLLSGKQRTAA